MSGKLIFQKFLKLSEDIKKIIFEFQKVKLCESKIIINKENVIGETQI